MRYRRKSGQSTLSNGPGDDGTAHLCWYFGETFIGIPHHPMAIHPDPSAVLCTYGQRRRDGRYKSPEIPALGFFFSSSPVKPSSLSLPLFVPPYQCPSLLVVVIASIILPGPTHYNTPDTAWTNQGNKADRFSLFVPLPLMMNQSQR